MTKLTPKKIEKFLTEFAECGSVKDAAKAIRVSRQALYKRRAEDEDFAKAWEVAEELATGTLEDEAARRALNGSDTLLMFLLKARNDKYKDNKTLNHKGNIGIGQILDEIDGETTGLPEA